jgi:hypothetical protein
MSEPKSAQLQIRVSPAQKSAIQRAAAQAGRDMSSFVLDCLFPAPAGEFQRCVEACLAGDQRFALAELNSLLTGFSPGELRIAVAAAPAPGLTPLQLNYVAAMVEYACARRSLDPPLWTGAVAPLPEPFFGTTLQSLRLYLLSHSPPPFRRRNIFIDSSLGARV